MKRKNGRASRVLGVALVCTLGTGVAVGVSKLRDDDGEADSTPLLALETSSKPQDTKADAAKGPLLLVTQAVPATRPALVTTVTPSAAPTTMPVAGAQSRPIMPPPAHAPQRTGNPLVDAEMLVERGDVVAARALLNDAILGGGLGAADAVVAKQRVAKLNESLVFGRRVFKDDGFGGAYTVRSGENMQAIARAHGISWEFLGRLNGISDPRKLRAMQTLKVVRGPFHAVVSKRAFVMDVYLGTPGQAGAMYVTSFNVGLGKDGSTPTGSWVAHNKLKNPEYYSPRGEGIIPADDPRNPLGEFWIGLRGIDGAAVGSESYGIHGTIEPETIGKEESMGCIRLTNEDAGRVFELLVEGKSIVIVRE